MSQVPCTVQTDCRAASTPSAVTGIGDALDAEHNSVGVKRLKDCIRVLDGFGRSLEVILQMLEVYDQTQNAEFARKQIVPFADAILTFYDQHYPRNSANKITLVPAQSLETYQLVAINPTPDLAGLMNILPRLVALPSDTTSETQRTAWTRLLKELPPIPIGKTAKGKLPPLGQGDAVIFAVNQRPVKGSRGVHRTAMRHGVSSLRHGERYTLGIIFHDAA